MKRRLPAEGKQKVDTALENWLGVALYRDEGGLGLPRFDGRVDYAACSAGC